MKKSMAKVLEEEKLTGDEQPGKKAELTKLIAEKEAVVETLSHETVAVEAAPNNEKTDKLKDLQKSLKDIEAKQAKEEKDLRKVQAAIKSLVDPPKEPETDYADKHTEPKPDLTPFKKNLAKIEKEEEEKEEFIEKRKAALDSFPKNPLVEASEAAEEAHEEAMKKAFAEKKAEEEAAEEAELAKKAAHEAAQKAMDKKVKDSAELWTANMPEKFLSSFLQTKVNEIRYQLAQVEE